MFGWNIDLSLFDDEIDAHHEKIFVFCENLYYAISSDVESEVQALFDLIELHLVEEEKMLREIKYPEYEAHKRIHNVFRAKLAEMRARVIANHYSTLVLMDLARMVSGWFYLHIRQVDMLYVPYKAPSTVTLMG